MRARPHFSLMPLSMLVFCAAGLCAEPPAGGRGASSGQGAQAPAAGNGRIAVLIGFRNVPGPSEQAVVRSQAGVIKYSYHLVPAIAASIPEQARAALLANPTITRIELDGTVRALDTELDNAWGVKRIGAGLVHDALNKGTGVKVAVIDTGIDYTHPDLDANYKGGTDLVNNDDDPVDDHGHGTHVAGTIAAVDNGTGVVGVAPEAWLYAVKILDSTGSGSDSDMIAAMQWAVDNEMQVVNLSLGTPADPGDTVKQAFDNAAGAGIVTVAAAGNSGFYGLLTDTVNWPARYESVIAVGATDSTDSLAYFSSIGPQVDLAAPGVNIRSTLRGGGYGLMSGTSMATPHVTGTAALIIAAGWPDVRARLASTADDLAPTGRDTWYGDGLVDADEAAGGGTPPANQAPTASFTYTSATLSCSFNASGSTDPDGSIAAYAWSFGDGGTGTGVNIDHTYASAGTYTVTLTVTDNDGATNAAEQNITVSAPSNQPPTASFTHTATGLACQFDGSGSSDSDGTVTAYAWNFGDGSSGSGATASHTYTSADTYTVVLTVTDNDGATGSQSKSVTVEVGPVIPTMHVGGIDLSYETQTLRKGGTLYRVQAVVRILDASNDAVNGAVVSGSWSGAYARTVSGSTTGDGTVTFTTDWVKPRKVKTFAFTVTDVVKSDSDYDSSTNVETSDSVTVK